MSYETHGPYGTTEGRWEGTQLYVKLAKIFKRHKTAGQNEVARRFADELQNDSDLELEAAKYIVRNCWNKLSRGEKEETGRISPNRGSSQRVRRDPEAKAAKARAVRETVESLKKTILLDLVLSTGKRLRYSTFAEAKAEGGWLVKLGKVGQPNQVIGETLTEEQVWKVRGND